MIQMGTSYYMVKGKEKIYVGRNVYVVDLEDFKNDIKTVRDLCWSEDGCGWNLFSKTSFSLEDLGIMYRIIHEHIKMVSLFESPYLLAFYLSHDESEWSDWDLKSDSELEE